MFFGIGRLKEIGKFSHSFFAWKDVTRRPNQFLFYQNVGDSHYVYYNHVYSLLN